MRLASCTTLYPGVLHLASAGDVDQLAAWCRYPRHGAWNDQDVLGVWGEGVDAVVSVGVAQNKTIISLAEDMGGEVYRLLGHVFDRVFFHLLAELLDVLSRLFRSDEDILAAPATAALYYQLVEVVDDVAAVLLDGERVSLHVAQHRLLSEVGPDHLGNKGIDALVVGDAEVGGEDGVDEAPGLGFDQALYVVVDPAVLDALVDDVDSTTALFVDEPSIVVELDLVPFGQDRPELAGEDLVVEVVLVMRSCGEDRQGRFRLGRSGPHDPAQALHQPVERSYPERLVGLG